MSAERPKINVAIDLGASGGRVATGRMDGDKLHVEIAHTFPNGAVPTGDRLYWNHLGLWQEIRKGLRLAGSRGEIASIGVNSWGVDFVLLDEAGNVLDGLRHYRDPRTNGVMEQALAEIGRSEVYKGTGIQFMSINTIYQLLAMRSASPKLLECAEGLLMVPDLFHYWLTGVKLSEATDASTTQLFDPNTRNWNYGLIEQAGIPARLFGRVVEPGSVIGPVLPEIADLIGTDQAVIIAPGSHDTASAVAAVPAVGDDWAYISSGTWSLVGIEIDHPVVTEQALEQNFTNEAGIDGTTRLLKNMMGLWILQECRRFWNDVDYATLHAEAETVDCECSVIDPDDARFLQPSNCMEEQVASFCRETNQRVPSTRGEFVRCILESIALKAALLLDALVVLGGKPINVVHIVGGGSQIGLLNQLIADSSGRLVVAGPVEATLTGNLLLQARTLGSLEGKRIREVVRESVTLKTVCPQGSVTPSRQEFARKIFAGSAA